MKLMKTRKRKQKRAFPSTAIILCLFLQAGIQVGSLADDKEKKEKKPPYDPTSAYEIRKIEGWKVYVLKRLEKEKPEILRRALRLVEIQLYQITLVIPDGPLKKLR